MPKRPIPNIPKSSIGSDRQQFDQAVKENLEVITGQRSADITPLASTASNADIIAKINQVIAQLQ